MVKNFLKNLLSPNLLRIGKSLFRKNDVFSQMRKMSFAQRQDNQDNGTIIFYAPRWWTTHQAWEGVISEYFRAEGLRPIFISCGGLMTMCETYLLGIHANGSECGKCQHEMSYFLEKWGLEHHTLKEYLSVQMQTDIRNAIAALGGQQFESFSFQGVNPWSLAEASINRYFLSTNYFEEENIPTIKLFLESTLMAHLAMENMLAEIKPELVFMLNGKFSSEKALSEICEKKSINYVSYERGKKRDTLILAKNESVLEHDLSNRWDEIRETFLKPNQENDLNSYLKLREKGTDFIDNFWPEINREKEQIISELQLDTNKKIVTLFTNVLWDTAVFKKDIAFKGMFDWIESSIEVFENMEDVQLVIRVHPAEVRVARQETRQRVMDELMKKYPRMAKNIKIVPPESAISSYVLSELSSALLVYTTTVGMEMVARMGIPVVVSGEVHYARKGFTFDLNSREDYPQLIQEALKSGKSVMKKEYARRYLYAFYYRYHFEIPEIEEVNHGDFLFKFQNIQEIEKRKNADLKKLVKLAMDTSYRGSLYSDLEI